MIGKAKSISHGINDIRYISGESRNKEHPELIYHLKEDVYKRQMIRYPRNRKASGYSPLANVYKRRENKGVQNPCKY